MVHHFTSLISRHRWEVALSLSLIAASVIVYGLQVVLFAATRDTLFYLMQDLAFVPIQVIAVTFVINRLLAKREKQGMLRR